MQYSCKYIDGAMLFDFNNVCCACSDTGGIVFKENYKGEIFDYEEITSIRENIIEGFKEGIVPEKCKNCFALEEVAESNIKVSKTINNLFISNWRHCNCGCIYCDYGYLTLGKFSQKVRKSDYYDIFPMIKKLLKQKYIDENTHIRFLGGECTVLKEFDQVAKLLASATKARMWLLSSGVKHSRTIENLLKKDKCFVVVSVDCGCRETYEKIKRTDMFEALKKNIKRYVSASKSDEQVVLKYIIIRGYNDNEQELLKFIDIARVLNVKSLILNLDHRVKNGYNMKIPSSHKLLYKVFYENTKDFTIIDSIQDKLLVEQAECI